MTYGPIDHGFPTGARVRVRRSIPGGLPQGTLGTVERNQDSDIPADQPQYRAPIVVIHNPGDYTPTPGDTPETTVVAGYHPADLNLLEDNVEETPAARGLSWEAGQHHGDIATTEEGTVTIVLNGEPLVGIDLTNRQVLIWPDGEQARTARRFRSSK